MPGLSLIFAFLLPPPASAGVWGAPPPVGEVGASSAPWLQVIWPPPGLEYPYVKDSFTLGNVKPGSTLTVNGQPMRVEKDGGFLDMVPFSTGPFTLAYAVEWGGVFSSASVRVKVAQPEGLPITDDKTLLALEPSEDLEVRAGDLVTVLCKGPPGRAGIFRIDGLTSKLPLAERKEGTPGVYEGHFRVQSGSRGAGLEVKCGLKGGFWGGLSAEAKGKVTVLDPSQTRTAEIKADYAILKTLPGGYSLFFPKGVRLEITGRRGNLSRARLSETLSGWVDTDRLNFLPAGAPPPRGTVGQWVHTIPDSESVRVKIRLREKIPFEVIETVEPLGFKVRFYGADERFDRIVYRSDDPIVKELRWRQESADVVEVSVQTRLHWGWGYHADYDDGYFVLEIRRPPDLSRSANVLAGRKVVLDPGHGPMEWSHGPHGHNERDLVLKVGLKLERMLLAEGADVYMTRRSTDGPPLADRPRLAWDARGDVYVSIHFNGFRETWNPRSSPRGFTTFYYQPHSLPFVEAMHESYRKRHSDLADESVRWGDLHVLRVTEMPSVLTESAYLALPEHERFIITDSYQERLAGTMLEGIRAFYEDYRAIQRRSPAERIAAGAP